MITPKAVLTFAAVTSLSIAPALAEPIAGLVVPGGTPSDLVHAVYRTPVGGNFLAFLAIDDLGDDLLAEFQLQVEYSDALEFESVAFGQGLGAPDSTAGWLELANQPPGIGAVELFESTNLDATELRSRQPTEGFILAVLRFTALKAGTYGIGLRHDTALWFDESGRLLDVPLFEEVVSATVVVPETSVLMLLGVGLGGVVLRRTRSIALR